MGFDDGNAKSNPADAGRALFNSITNSNEGSRQSGRGPLNVQAPVSRVKGPRGYLKRTPHT